MNKQVTQQYFRQVVCNAKKRGIKVDVTLDYITKLFNKQNGLCAYSGVPLTFYIKNVCDDTTASLDRIDSTKGYVKGNVQWVHKMVNHIKREISEEKFLFWCAAVAKYQKT